MILTVTKATVLLTRGADKVSLDTDLPCPFVKEYLPSQPPLYLSFETTQDMGIEYVRRNFGIEPEVINVR